MIKMTEGAVFRRRLKNILPQETKTHRYSEGDCSWQLIFCFDVTELPDGSTVSGDVLCIENFFGDISVTFNGRTALCSVNQQEQWTEGITDTISQHIADNTGNGQP